MTTLRGLPHALALLAALALGLALAACNTIEGAGEDAAATGRAVPDAAEDAKGTLRAAARTRL